MAPSTVIEFHPFVLDLAREELKRGEETLRLRPKAFALLRYLAQHPGILVTKDEILDSVWPGRVVSESGLTELVRELRKHLNDDARTPRYVETVHGRGYRFIGLSAGNTSREHRQQPSSVAASSAHGVPAGRRAELDRLSSHYGRALAGERQIVFVSGEPGIGKTTLVEAFSRHLASEAVDRGPMAIVTRGQCIEQYGAGEPYLPVLEAMARLAREGGTPVVDVLKRFAPTWLRRMPSLLDNMAYQQIERSSENATAERMLREMAEALEALTTNKPLVLILEDLHWSDYSTIDLVSRVALRLENALLMLIGTFRPVEVHTLGHPLRDVILELKARARCTEIALDCLDRDAVEAFVHGRFPSAGRRASVRQLAQAIHQRTDGHPLFMVNVANYVEAIDFEGLPESVLASMPETVRQMIEKQLERLAHDDRAILEAAAVAGAEFSSASVAAALGADEIDGVEERCSRLAKREQFLIPKGTQAWPDGTFAARFGFIHALYQNVIYFAIPAGRRARIHERIARREARAWSQAPDEIANELAVHFEAARLFAEAIEYYALAGDKAVRAWADREAIDLYSRALELLPLLAESKQRDQSELQLLIKLGVPLIHVRGYAATRVGEVYARASALRDAVGNSSQRYAVLWGLWLYYVVRGEHSTALQTAKQLRALSKREDKPFPLAHYAWGCSTFWSGQSGAAVDALTKAIETYEPERDLARINDFSQDAKSVSLLYRGWALWVRGYPDQALECCAAALDWATRLAHPFTLAFTHSFVSVLRSLRRDDVAALDHGNAALRLCEEHGFEFFHAWATIVTGRAIAASGDSQHGLDTLRRGMEAHEAAGAHMAKTLWYAFIAETYLNASRATEGMAVIDEARAFEARADELVVSPELVRLKGELLLIKRPGTGMDVASRYFTEAMDAAAERSDRSWQLRAAMSLARMHIAGHRELEAAAVLEPVYTWFSEGLNTRDLLEARQLLEIAR